MGGDGGGRIFAVVGGGVAGVTCAQELCRLCSNVDTVVLISSQKLVKRAVVVDTISETLEDVELVVERGDAMFAGLENVKYVDGAVRGLDPGKKMLLLDTGESLGYDEVCICTGASPRNVLGSDCATTLRDTDSVVALCEELEHCSTLMVVGNGGIALDVVAALGHIETYWVVRHESIGDAFFDAEVGEFLLGDIEYIRRCPETERNSSGLMRGNRVQETAPGASAGPTWVHQLVGSERPTGKASALHIERSCEVVEIHRNDSKIHVTLSNGKTIMVDTVISAIGVDPRPNISWVPDSILRAPDGGIQVSKDMQTSYSHVYAAGDACTVVEDPDSLWFQMRLWSQARFMGLRAAHCMLNIQDQMASDLPFDLFIHVTHFLGKRIVLLGCFNGQKLNDEDEDGSSICLYSRVLGSQPDRTFVRVVLKDGKVKGAICIGDTGLEETLENLIMDGIDVSCFGPDILDPDCDLDDIFD